MPTKQKKPTTKNITTKVTKKPVAKKRSLKKNTTTTPSRWVVIERIIMAGIVVVLCSVAIVVAIRVVAEASVSFRTVSVSTSDGLKKELLNATAGETIQLADGVYTGKFITKNAGTPNAPIILTGTRNAILDGGSIKSGYVLHLVDANYWQVRGITVRNGQKGIMADRTNHTTVDSVDVTNTGQEAVHFRSCSSDNIISNNVLHNTGMDVYTDKKGKKNETNLGFGEGVYIGNAQSNWKSLSTCAGPDKKNGKLQPDMSDRNQILNNTFMNISAENIDIKEGTTGGTISGNHFNGNKLTNANFADSWIDIKGNDYRVTANSGIISLADGFQTHVNDKAKGWGRNNVFDGNNLNTSTVPGYGIRIQVNEKKNEGTGNIVKCNNTVNGAKLGLANIACVQ
jgi:hypothetical protein